MNMKIALLLILAISLALFGCAKKAGTQNVTEGAGQGGPSMGAAGNASAGAGANASSGAATGSDANVSGSGSAGSANAGTDKNQDLADLFNISTDEPLGDEGLGTSTPGSNKS